MALNPFPDPTSFALDVPGGVTVQADGKVSLLRVIVSLKDGRVSVDYAVREEQKTAAGMARALRFDGLNGGTQFVCNGKVVEARGGVVPLSEE